TNQMICLAAAFGVLGLVAMGRAHPHCHGHHGYGWYGPYGDGDDRHHRGRRMMLRALFRKLDATPAHERAIVAQVDKLTGRGRGARASVQEARGELAAALRGPVLDDAALGAMLGRVDAAVGDARAAVIDALRGVHGVLDDRQRAQVADAIERRGWWRRSSP